VSAKGVPDSQDLHARYDLTEESFTDGETISTLTDQTGNGYDLTASGNPTARTNQLGGNTVARLDGSDDLFDVAFSNLAQPNHIFIAWTSGDGSGVFFTSESSAGDRNEFNENGSGNWQIFAGSALEGGATSSGDYISSTLYNGTSSHIRLNGADEATGNAGTESLNGLMIGNSPFATDFADMDIGEILLYDADKSNKQSEIESYLNDKWSVF
jgi:hypothetical protein